MRTISKWQRVKARVRRFFGRPITQKEKYFLDLMDHGYYPRVGIFMNENFKGTEEELYEEMNRVNELIFSGKCTPLEGPFDAPSPSPTHEAPKSIQ